MSDDQQPDLHDIGAQSAADGERAGQQDQLTEPREAFDELSKLVLGEQSLTAVLQRVAELAKSVIRTSTRCRPPS